VSYAGGSSWAALEEENVLRPGGPHDVDRVAGGAGGVDGNGAGTEVFDWADFRLKFGCQEKVRFCYCPGAFVGTFRFVSSRLVSSRLMQ
jgi:hypothetical protein